MYTYLCIDLAVIAVPLLCSFHPKLRFHKQWYAFFPATVGMMAVFIPWDAFFTAQGVWRFNTEHLVGIQWLGLPAEEWLFFFCVPYACVFSYHCFQVLGWGEGLAPHARWIGMLLVMVCGAAGGLHFNKAYTSSTFLLLAIWLGFLVAFVRPVWIGRFYFTYAIMLVPFLLVNGMLTGTGLERPVVEYNDHENLGMRIGTIPLEDVFYGMLMVLMTITLYEAIRERVLHPTEDR